MSVDNNPGRKSTEIPEKHYEMGMQYDKIPLNKDEEADAVLVEGGQRYGLENPTSEVERPDF
jgi:hypothetical protein